MRYLCLLALGSGLAFAADSHKVTFYQPATVNGTAFKAGEVKVEMKDNVVVFKQGKTIAEAKAKVEAGPSKFVASSVSLNGDTKSVQEIRLAGTATKLVFEEGKAAVAAGNE